MTDPGDQPSSSQPDGLLSPRKRIALRIIATISIVLLIPLVLLKLAGFCAVTHGARLYVIVAAADIHEMVEASRLYREKHGEFPQQPDQIVAAGVMPHGIPVDPWGQSYEWRYAPDGLYTQVRDKRSRPIEIVPAPDCEGIYVYSIGENGLDESGVGDDISSWDRDRNYLLHESYIRPSPRPGEHLLNLLSWCVLPALFIVYLLVRRRLNKDLKARDRLNDPWHRAPDRAENGRNCQRKGEYS